MFNKKTAFTLAEVLLVLAIIGVIAAVTIPGIMQQSSEKKFAALAKKTVSTLQNAINLKLATVPVGPGDLGMGLLEWLLDGEEDGTNTLKSVQTNADSSAVQFPDGVLVFYGSGRCTTQPTRTRLNNASAMLSSQMSNATGYDQIYLNVNNDGRIRIYSNNPGIQEDIRAKKYLGL